jgi:hypothetical protein
VDEILGGGDQPLAFVAGTWHGLVSLSTDSQYSAAITLVKATMRPLLPFATEDPEITEPLPRVRPEDRPLVAAGPGAGP